MAEISNRYELLMVFLHELYSTNYILTFTPGNCHLKVIECDLFCQLLFVSLA